MKYKDLQDYIQTHLDKSGWIEGYINRQEMLAERPCRESIKGTAVSDRLSLRRSSGVSEFYDLYVNVVGQDIRIGKFTSDGTIKKQAIRFVLFNTEKYGEDEIIMAFLNIAKDYFSSKLDKDSELLRKKQAEMDTINNEIAVAKQKMIDISTAIGITKSN